MLSGGFSREVDTLTLRLVTSEPMTNGHLELNVLRFQDEVTQVIIHEHIHAFDECHTKVIWSNCAHHACSEVPI
ncbi:hypothetical protein L6164_005776 [Bauhinia variegata]|uniref:Uncharacterized protein n=1 Tax=Bauhinia variegata TaxID=167791 RepID=A0ACB9PUG3_BAUVA|nr:hypothetical protein L6164_005776 [Bauhinia variegata]